MCGELGVKFQWYVYHTYSNSSSDYFIRDHNYYLLNARCVYKMVNKKIMQIIVYNKTLTVTEIV